MSRVLIDPKSKNKDKQKNKSTAETGDKSQFIDELKNDIDENNSAQHQDHQSDKSFSDSSQDSDADQDLNNLNKNRQK